MALSHHEKRFAAKFYKAIGTTLSLQLLAALERGQWDHIAECRVDPRDYDDRQEYFLDASAASLLRKFSALPSTHDRYGTAVANWKKGEVQCFKTNQRLAPYVEGFTHPDAELPVLDHLDRIRKKIALVLGRAPSMDALNPRHGPGATFSDKSVRSTIADKMESCASITNTAYWFLLDYWGTSWGREASRRGVYPVEVRGNRFTTAPKDALKDRPIAAEPSINVFYQLALGSAVRQRLKRIGIDLDTAQSKHRQEACSASITGNCCTLDLSNASDTVAYNLVKLLLPADWFSLFDELRSPFTRFAGADCKAVLGREAETRAEHWFKLEKFSSMGNGFTFELETLLFWAISDYAVESAVEDPIREKTLVFGDDIICDSRGARSVTALLRFFGFSLNEEKSFVDGTFRESCGGDFYGGRPVRPIFLKDPLDEPQQLIAFANSIYRLAQDLYSDLGPLAGLWFSIQDQLPVRVRRCRGPQSLGDSVIWDEEVNWSWTSLRNDRVWGYVPVKHREVSLSTFNPGTVFACGLYGLEVSKGYLTPRDAVQGYGFRKLWIHQSDWLPTVKLRKGLQGVEVIDHGPQGPRYDATTRRIARSAL